MDYLKFIKVGDPLTMSLRPPTDYPAKYKKPFELNTTIQQKPAPSAASGRFTMSQEDIMISAREQILKEQMAQRIASQPLLELEQRKANNQKDLTEQFLRKGLESGMVKAVEQMVKSAGTPAMKEEMLSELLKRYTHLPGDSVRAVYSELNTRSIQSDADGDSMGSVAPIREVRSMDSVSAKSALPPLKKPASLLSELKERLAERSKSVPPQRAMLTGDPKPTLAERMSEMPPQFTGDPEPGRIPTRKEEEYRDALGGGDTDPRRLRGQLSESPAWGTFRNLARNVQNLGTSRSTYGDMSQLLESVPAQAEWEKLPEGSNIRRDIRKYLRTSLGEDYITKYPELSFTSRGKVGRPPASKKPAPPTRSR